MDTPTILRLLEQADWGQYAPLREELLSWPCAETVFRALQTLRRDRLYQSPVHGVGHTERTMLLGALCAMRAGLDEERTALALDACAYHDVGREDDRYDTSHGYRSSLHIGELTGRQGYELTVLRAAVTVHSRRDPDFAGTMDSFGLLHDETALTVARVLKDADGLDRVRVNDLDVSYMRLPHSGELEQFAYALYKQYQTMMGLDPVPLYYPPVVRMVRARLGETATPELLWDRPAFFRAAQKSYAALAARGEAPAYADWIMRYFGLTEA